MCRGPAHDPENEVRQVSAGSSPCLYSHCSRRVRETPFCIADGAQCSAYLAFQVTSLANAGHPRWGAVRAPLHGYIVFYMVRPKRHWAGLLIHCCSSLTNSNIPLPRPACRQIAYSMSPFHKKVGCLVSLQQTVNGTMVRKNLSIWLDGATSGRIYAAHGFSEDTRIRPYTRFIFESEELALALSHAVGQKPN